MKTIIVSDIESREESIIPFALNFAKTVDDEAHIVHVIDPRKQHAVSSAYSDSQTFEVGEKMTYDEIIGRELHRAKTKLNKLLSYEASRLNYPLRIKKVVEKSNLTEQLFKLLGKNSKGLIITSKVPDGMIFEDLDEFVEIYNNFNINSLVVPPGFDFIAPVNALLITNLDEDHQPVIDIINFLKPLDLLFNVADSTYRKNEIEKNLKAEEFKRKVMRETELKNEIRTTLFKGENHLENIMDHLNWSPYDMVIVHNDKKTISNRNPFTKDSVRQLIENLDLPVLLC